MSDAQTRAQAEGVVEPFSRGYAYYALGILTLVYTFNFIDRQIVAALIEPIKADLNINDTQAGLLTGLAFALVYTTVGIPLAALADRSNRRNIIAYTLALFSAMTVACGLATNFWWFLAARIGVGIGEAGTSPPAHSMLSDMFAPESRATAMAVYGLGINFGIMIGFFVSGWIYDATGEWRYAFYAFGLPGILLALILRFTVKEPPRGISEKLKPTSANLPAPSLNEVIKHLWRQKSFRHIALGASLNAFAGYAGTTWNVAFMIRSHDLSVMQAATIMALVAGIAGGIGTFLSGYLADRMGKRDVRWNMWVPAIAILAAAPFGLGYYLIPNSAIALPLLIIPTMVGVVYLAPSLAMSQGLATLRMRAMVSAILFFILNLIGLGLGPFVAGALSDGLNAAFDLGSESLRYSLVIVGLFNVWSAIHFYLASRTLKDDLAYARKLSAGETS